MTDSENKKLKVIGVFNLFPHYRMAIFESLWRSDDIDVTICAGTNSNRPSLDIHTSESLTEYINRGQFIPLKNHWLGKNFLWQAKVARPRFYRNYDVVIFTGSVYQLSTWLALFWLRLIGKRTLLWTHGLLKPDQGVKGFIRKVFYRLSDGLLLYGHRAKHLLRHCGFESNSLYIVYNSLDYKTQKKYRESVSIEDERAIRKKFKYMALPLLIFIGRLTVEKHPLLMVDLAQRMKELNRPVNIMVIGDGPDLNVLKKNIRQRNLGDYVYLFGQCYDEAMLARLMCAANMAIIPGYVGLSAVHCLAYGLPVITSDDLENQKPEVEVIVNEKTGGFYGHGDLDSLSCKVFEWLDKNNPQTRKNCIHQIEQYYTPMVQQAVINYACRGLPANQQPHYNNRH